MRNGENVGMRTISVIIPCYNVENYIDRCLLSITTQTIGIEKLEIICVDDASTDGTWEHLKQWEQAFPDHMVLIRQKENRRQGAARNLALQHACAEWISYVDADDWLEPDFFERLYEPAVRLDCDVVCCDYKRDASMDPGSGAEKRAKGEEQYIVADTAECRKKILTDRIFNMVAHTKIIRKKLLTDHQIFFPEDVVYEDHYWVPLLQLYAEKIYVIHEQLYHYFWNPQSTVLSRNQDHHLDGLTVQMMKWEDYERRGLLEIYREELEYDFLQDAIDFVEVILLWRDEVPFSFFKLESELIRRRIPDYKKNPYGKLFTKVDRVLLEALYKPADKEEFCDIARRAVPEYKIKSQKDESADRQEENR